MLLLNLAEARRKGCGAKTWSWHLRAHLCGRGVGRQGCRVGSYIHIHVNRSISTMKFGKHKHEYKYGYIYTHIHTCEVETGYHTENPSWAAGGGCEGKLMLSVGCIDALRGLFPSWGMTWSESEDRPKQKRKDCREGAAPAEGSPI